MVVVTKTVMVVLMLVMTREVETPQGEDVFEPVIFALRRTSLEDEAARTTRGHHSCPLSMATVKR